MLNLPHVDTKSSEPGLTRIYLILPTLAYLEIAKSIGILGIIDKIYLVSGSEIESKFL